MVYKKRLLFLMGGKYKWILPKNILSSSLWILFSFVHFSFNLWQKIYDIKCYSSANFSRKMIYISFSEFMFLEAILAHCLQKADLAEWGSFSSNLKPLFVWLAVLAIFHESYISLHLKIIAQNSCSMR